MNKPEKRVLECSTRGDKRFSALVARVRVAGYWATIEEHYQLSKRFKGSPAPTTWREGKGKAPDYLVVVGRHIPESLKRAFYDMLWVKYLDAHPDLVEYAKLFDDYSDCFARPGGVSQADSIRAYVKSGRESITSRWDVVNLTARLSTPE
jgi:hypothetical protein